MLESEKAGGVGSFFRLVVERADLSSFLHLPHVPFVLQTTLVIKCHKSEATGPLFLDNPLIISKTFSNLFKIKLCNLVIILGKIETECSGDTLSFN